MLFSKKGFSVTAVDFAETPIHNLETNARSLSLSIETIKKDIFDLTPDYSSQFDYIIEQTCFCAIDPLKRKQYSNLVHDLLKVGGKLIGLWMPLDKDIIDGGPPFGVKENEIKKNKDEGTYCHQKLVPKLNYQVLMLRFLKELNLFDLNNIFLMCPELVVYLKNE